MILKKYQNYVFSLFIKKFILVSLIFFCIVIIINFFEEIKFSEKYNTDIYYTVYLSFLNAPSLIFEIFPFIFLITVKIFYLNLLDKNELTILNSNGISNFKIILYLGILAGVMGLFLLLFYYSLSSTLKSEYLDIKNRFSNTNEYLAVVNDDGLWIKEEIEKSLFIIHAKKFDKNILKSITISETDKYYNHKNTISAETANISSKNWKLDNVSVLNEDGTSKELKSLVHNSSFQIYFLI